MSTDVHVIGAGPAGIFAAISALRLGKGVVLSEEHRRAGDPVHCSGLVSASGLEQMGDVVDFKKCALNSINKANIHGKNENFSLSFPVPKAYVIDRGKFDSLAFEKYKEEGGKAVFGEKITSFSQLKSTNIIGADGPISSIARLFNFPPISSYCGCWQGEFKYSCPQKDAVEVFFNPEISPGFIGWAIPTDEENAKIGLGVGKNENLSHAKKSLLSLLGIKDASLHEFSALIPLSPRKKCAGALSRAGKNFNAFLCGDAAGQVKSTSGGGIFFGAMCGRIAAQNFENPARYESEWRKKYGMDLLLHRLLRLGFDSLSADGTDFGIKALKLMKIDSLLMEAGQMDEYSKMLSLNTLNAYMHVLTR